MNAAHLPAHRLLQRIEPIAAGERRWRRRRGWRSLLHGVGSFSILAIGTYAASANFHQPRDTTSADFEPSPGPRPEARRQEAPAIQRSLPWRAKRSKYDAEPVWLICG